MTTPTNSRPFYVIAADMVDHDHDAESFLGCGTVAIDVAESGRAAMKLSRYHFSEGSVPVIALDAADLKQALADLEAHALKPGEAYNLDQEMNLAQMQAECDE